MLGNGINLPIRHLRNPMLDEVRMPVVVVCHCESTHTARTEPYVVDQVCVEWGGESRR